MTHQRGPLIGNLLAQIGFGLLAMTLCLPSMQAWAGLFDTSQSVVQLVFSVYVLAYGGLQLFFGPLSDRLGRRRVLMIGLTVGLLGSLIAATASSVEQLVLGRLVQGAGGAAGMVVGRSMVQDLFEGHERTRVMAFVGMAMGCIPPAATLLGGQIHVHLGWQWNFILLAVIGCTLLLLAWRGLPADHRRAASHANTLGFVHAYARLAQESVFLQHLVILAGTTATFYTFLSGAPLVLASYGVGPEGVGWHIACIPMAYFCGNYLTTRLIHGWGAQRVMRVGQALTLSGIVLMLLSVLSGLTSPWAVSLPLVLVGLGHGLLVPPTLAATVAVVPALAGAAAGAAGVMQQFTGALGGYLVGLVPHSSALGMGLMMLAFAGPGTLMLRWLRRQ